METQKQNADFTYFSQLLEEIKSDFQEDSSGHDITHLIRVFNITITLAEKEGCDNNVLGAAALLHDIHRIMSKKQNKYVAIKDSLPVAEKILKKVNFPTNLIPAVLHCIEHHEDYSFGTTDNKAETLEALIIQDADNLDAIGAIGIARTCMYGGAHGSLLWDSETPPRKDLYDDSQSDGSIINHFYEKLLKLKQNMNTETAKKMAQHRHQVMEQFLEEFFAEWDGVR